MLLYVDDSRIRVLLLVLVDATRAAPAAPIAPDAPFASSLLSTASGYLAQLNNNLSLFCEDIKYNQRIKKEYLGRNGGSLSIEGKKQEIVFSWSTEAERAASALLALAWYCADYRNVVVASRANAHSLTAREREHRIIVGLSARYELGALPTRVEVVGPGAVPTTPRLHVRLATFARNNTNCTHAFFISSFYFDEDKLRNCLFLTGSEKKTTIYIPKEWNSVTDPNSIMYKESEAILEFLGDRHHIMVHKNKSRSELQELVLKAQNQSFLFVDVELWHDVEDVAVFAGIYRPPPFGDTLVRFVDKDLRRYAPSLADAARYFSPRTSDVREVLALDTTDPLRAAATWALQATDHRRRLVDWFYNSTVPIRHYMDVILCDDMNNIDYNESLLDIVKHMNRLTLAINYIGIQVDKHYVDCNSTSSWSKVLTDSRGQRKYHRLIGTVMSGEGAYNVAAEVESFKPHLLAYSMTGMRQVFPLGGTPKRFVQTLRGILHNCRVRRIAVISEQSFVAGDVTAELQRLHDTGALRARDVSLFDTSEDTIDNTLHSLVNDNARIFLINGNAQFTKNIIRIARKKKLTPKSGYFWIVREWAGPGDDIMEPYELTFAYRGGGQNLTSSELSKLERNLTNTWENKTWPQYITPLANAILTLGIGFTKLTRTLPDAIDDVHSPEARRWFLENFTSLSSMVGELRLEKHEVKDARTFLYRWSDRLPLLINTPTDGCPLTAVPHDGSITCYTSSGGEAFPPTCNDRFWLLIGLASIILLFVFIIIAIICHRSLRARDKRLTEQAEKMGRARLDAFISSLAPSFIDRKALKKRYQIGSGRFGLVWFGMLQEPTGVSRPVAVKALREGAVAEEQSEFFREARNLAVLQHKHVVRFVGVCVADGPPLLLMEYAFFGDLLQYLCNRRHLVESTESDSTEAQYVSAEALTRHAHDAATALAFLVRRGFVHRDVRAANCLIDDRRALKLADFGMAREMNGKGNEHAGEYWCRRRSLFPVLWMAPESLSRGVFSTASDIWSLGVLMLELITLGARPYGGRSPFSVVELVTTGGQPPLPQHVSADARELLLQCWRRTPAERPTAAAIASLLEQKPSALSPALVSDTSTSADPAGTDVEEEVDSGIGPSSPLSVRSISFDGNLQNYANTHNPL